MSRTLQQIEEEQRRLAEISAIWAAQQQQSLEKKTEPAMTTEWAEFLGNTEPDSEPIPEGSRAASQQQQPEDIPTKENYFEWCVEHRVEPTITDFKERFGASTAETLAAFGAMSEKDTEAPGPLTEKEVIQIVQRWVSEDENYELSERRTVEEMVEELQDAAEYRTSNIPVSKFREIVEKYAPNAPKNKPEPKPQAGSMKQSKNFSYPTELEPLVKSGVAVIENDDTGPVPGHVLVYRCGKCGQFKTECCGDRTGWVTAVRDDEKTLTSYGRQAVGLDPIKPPKPPKSQEQILQERMTDNQKQPWWFEFRGLTELEGTGDIKMYIENFLPEGVTLLCGLYKEGKSFLALSAVKALTSGGPLFGRPGYEVPEIVPVLYLTAESGDGELKMRCRKFGITEDKTLFLARTLSKGPMLGLDDRNLESLVKAMKPVIILETLIRFSDGDEDDASNNRKLANQLFRLIGLGALAIVVIHHSVKAINKSNPTMSEAARGSGDILAMADVILLAMRDDRLYQGGKGPNEIDLVGWGRDFNPVPMRLALTGKAPKDLPPGTITYAPGIVSYIDQGNFRWVDKEAVRRAKDETGRAVGDILEGMVLADPKVSLRELAEAVKGTVHAVRKTLGKRGWKRSRAHGDIWKRAHAETQGEQDTQV